MEKAAAVGEIIIVVKHIFDSISDFFDEAIPKDFYEILDRLTFLTSDFLKINQNGEILDKTERLGEAVLNLSNLVVFGILLFYGFKSLFAYFLSKRVDTPWKFFIRIIIFGILANASIFICYSGVYLAENCTGYIRSFVGEESTSFCFLEGTLEDDIEISEDDIEGGVVYDIDSLISTFTYFSLFFTSVCLGGRYLLIKLLILFSPVFIIFGGFRESEKIFFAWCKNFFYLVFLQVILAVILGVICSIDTRNEMLLQILICSLFIVISKNILKLLKFYH